MHRDFGYMRFSNEFGLVLFDWYKEILDLEFPHTSSVHNLDSFTSDYT